jgi:hypothetical protein
MVGSRTTPIRAAVLVALALLTGACAGSAPRPTLVPVADAHQVGTATVPDEDLAAQALLQPGDLTSPGWEAAAGAEPVTTPVDGCDASVPTKAGATSTSPVFVRPADSLRAQSSSAVYTDTASAMAVLAGWRADDRTTCLAEAIGSPEQAPEVAVDEGATTVGDGSVVLVGHVEEERIVVAVVRVDRVVTTLVVRGPRPQVAASSVHDLAGRLATRLKAL